MNKRSLFLALWCLCVFSARAQITQNGPMAQTADMSAETTQAWWDHVELLKERGVTGTSGSLVPYGQLTSGPFAGAQPSSARASVVINEGQHTFYDLDLRNLTILIEGGADVSFYNCRFGQEPGVKVWIAPLIAQGEGTRLTLRFCDFEGPGDGSGAGMMLRGPADDNGEAAFIDAAYCRTWGQAFDSWKTAHSVSRFCYFDPSVATDKVPETWEENETYQPGDYVVENDIYTAHVWEAWRATTEAPRFDLIGRQAAEEDIVGKQQSNGWVYRNPHADIFHIYGGRDTVRAEGHFINHDGEAAAEPVAGIPLGINNSVRRADGDKTYQPQGGATVRGCLVLRNENLQSFAIHNNLGASQDSEFLRLEYLRMGGVAKHSIYPNTPVAFDALQDLSGNLLQLPPHQQNTIDISEDYFARGNPRSEAPTLLVSSRWNIRPEAYQTALDKNGEVFEALIFLVDGERVVIRPNGGKTYANPDKYTLEVQADSSYTLASLDGTKFCLVKWRGQAAVTATDASGDDEPLDTTGELALANEFSRDKAPFDSGFGQRQQNEARIPFVVTAPANATIEARMVTATDGEEVATWTTPGEEGTLGWKEIGQANGQGELAADLFTGRHPEYLQRQIRIKGGDNEITSEKSFGVGHTIIVFAQSNLDQGFKASHAQTAKPKTLSVDMVQHYYHERFNQDEQNTRKVGPSYIRRWDTGVSDSVDVTGWPTAFANVLTESRPGEKFFVAWHVHEGTSYTDMVSDGGKRIPQVEAALADYFYADGQDRGGIAGGAWTHSPGSTAQFFEEVHFPIFFKKTKNGEPVTVPSKVTYGNQRSYQLDQWIGDWYDINHLTYALQDPHQFGPRGFKLSTATRGINPKTNEEEELGWFTTRESSRQSIREFVENPQATSPSGDTIMLPIYMGALNYSIGELNKEGTGYGDGTHPSNDTPDGGMLFNALLAHGFLRAAGLTDWPMPVFDRQYRHPDGQWWEWWSTAGPITTPRRMRGEARPTPPPGYDAAHWAEVVGFQVDKQPAERVELVEGRVRVYPPSGGTFAPDEADRITHGDGGASGHLNDGPDRIAELWKDIAIIDFDLPGIDGVALRAQIAPTQGDNVPDTTADTTPPTVEAVSATPTAIMVTYSEPIRHRGFGYFQINDSATNEIVVKIATTQEGTTPGTVTYDGNTLILRPNSPLPVGTYAWRPHKNTLEDRAGNLAPPVRNNYYHPFRIEAAAASQVASGKEVGRQGDLAVRLYPNPTQGAFLLTLPEIATASEVSVLNLSGKVLYRTQTQGSRTLPITTSLPSGSYLVKVVSPQGTSVARLIVE